MFAARSFTGLFRRRRSRLWGTKFPVPLRLIRCRSATMNARTIDATTETTTTTPEPSSPGAHLVLESSLKFRPNRTYFSQTHVALNAEGISQLAWTSSDFGVRKWLPWFLEPFWSTGRRGRVESPNPLPPRPRDHQSGNVEPLETSQMTS